MAIESDIVLKSPSWKHGFIGIKTITYYGLRLAGAHTPVNQYHFLEEKYGFSPYKYGVFMVLFILYIDVNEIIHYYNDNLL